MAFKVSIKWSGKKFDDIPFDPSEKGLTFKNQIYSLTSIPPNMQKVMIKGGMLKDDTPLSSLNISPDGSHCFLVMGTPSEKQLNEDDSNKKRVFLEDLSESEQLGQANPCGLVNLGNTCYMNATLQCLKQIPELLQSLKDFSRGSNVNGQVTTGLRDVLSSLSNKSSGSSFDPTIFLLLLRQCYPQFAQLVNGRPAQQDAEECWSQLVSSLNETLVTGGGEEKKSLIDKYLSGEFQTKLKSDEAPQEEEVIGLESFIKLPCHISSEVNYLHQGLKESLVETIERTSPTLQRSINYTKSFQISRLPKYLTIHMMRMFYKVDTKSKAKIMRRVQFPFDLDLNDFLTSQYREKLQPLTNLLREQEDYKALVKKIAKSKKANDPSTRIVDDKDAKEPKKLKDLKDELDPKLLSDEGGALTGQYELFGVLTHTGRTADSGHYMAYTKDPASDAWFKFDDDKVTEQKEEDISVLAGGGDRAMAYLLIYKSKSID